MESDHTIRCSRVAGYDVRIEFDGGSEQRQATAELRNAGVPVRLQHSPEWTDWFRPHRTWFLSVRKPGDRCFCGLAITVSPTRAVPGHRLLRVEGFGAADDDASRKIALGALKDLARSERRVIGLRVEVVTPDADVRARIEAVARELGFHRPRKRHHGSYTAVVPLSPEPSQIMAAFHPTARRHIRAPGKKGLEVRAITDDAFGGRIGELVQESHERSGGRSPKIDWKRQIAFSVAYPGLSRLVGTFDPSIGGERSLLGFAHAEMHGDHATYAHAGCTRRSRVNAPTTYAATWDLICWARETGARWFDLGGIPLDDDFSAGALAGITEFKRFFSREIVTVGDEWTFEPRPLRAMLGASARAAASSVSRVLEAGRKG